MRDCKFTTCIATTCVLMHSVNGVLPIVPHNIAFTTVRRLPSGYLFPEIFQEIKYTWFGVSQAVIVVYSDRRTCYLCGTRQPVTRWPHPGYATHYDVYWTFPQTPSWSTNATRTASSKEIVANPRLCFYWSHLREQYFHDIRNGCS